MVGGFWVCGRRPGATIKHENLLEICRQPVFLQRNAQTDIDFEIIAPDTSLTVACDARLVGQALTNLLKNAVESIQGRPGIDGDLPRGHVVVRVQASEGRAIV